MTAQTKAQRYAKLAKKRADLGAKRVHGAWAHTEDHKAVRDFAKSLLEKRGIKL